MSCIACCPTGNHLFAGGGVSSHMRQREISILYHLWRLVSEVTVQQDFKKSWNRHVLSSNAMVVEEKVVFVNRSGYYSEEEWAVAA